MKPVCLVTGHRNPDCDSLAAASALAWWANQTRAYGKEAVAVRQGEAPPQAAWLYAQAGFPLPLLRTDCRPTARELARPAIVVHPETPLGQATAQMFRAQADVAIVERAGHFEGVVSPLAPRTAFLLQSNIEDMVGTLLTFRDLVAGLELQPVAAAQAPEAVHRLVLALDATPALQVGDVVVAGRNPAVWAQAAQVPVAALILVDGLTAAVPPLPVWSYVGTAASLAARLGGCFSCDLARAEKPLVAEADTLLPELRQMLGRSPFAVPVVENGAVRGVVSHREAVTAQPHDVALVDHFERGQSIAGLEEANVVEIVDHHRVGDIETTAPVRIDARPWGSTASILADRLLREIHPLDAVPAGLWRLLLGAMISDTLLLTSPTTTAEDRRLAPRLAELGGVELRAFGLDLLRQGDRLTTAPAAELVRADAKPYQVGKTLLLVAQTETTDLGQLDALLEGRLRAALAVARTEAGAQAAVLMVTDVLAGNSHVLVETDKPELARRLAPSGSAEASRWAAPGWVSRKKQLLPHLLGCLKNST